MNKILLFMGTMLVLASCSTRKNTTKMTNVTEANIEQKLNQPLDYQQLKINASVKVDIPGQYIPSVKLTIYNEKDTKIWINAQVAVLNAGRALATPENFQGYEKLNKTYVDENYDFVNDLLGVNFINYHSLEQMLLGRVFIPIDFRNSTVNITETEITIKADKPMEISLDGKKYEYLSTLVFDGSLNLQKVNILDQTKNRELEILYENREMYKNLNLPKTVKIFIKDKKPKSITLNYNNFDNQSMETTFSIPSGYTKRELK